MNPGTQIDKYRISHLLGDGGMGAVYAAEHVVLARRAAIKVLHPHIASHPELVQRFINEAMGAASIDHRNIVRVLDCGQISSNGQWYIALEFLDGESLGSYMGRAPGPIDLTTALHILVEASNGLHAAHERGFVHRDVKPDNFFITRTADDPLRVIVLDFGIAKLNRPMGGMGTRSNVVMGTPAYMAPEQLRDSKDVDRRADIFALGVIAYEMATGTRPWGETTSLYEIIAQHSRMTAPPDPRQRRGDLPGPWAAVVARAMEPDPVRRWQTAKEFAWALAEATPMPYSRSGTVLLEKIAPELARSSTASLTVGRPVPPELLAPAAPDVVVTAPLRVSPLASISDGVPRSPDAGSRGTAVMPSGSDAVPRGPSSTLAGSSGQSVAAHQSAAVRRGHGVLIAAIAAGGLVIGGALALLLPRSDDQKPRATPSTKTPEAAQLDAGATAKAVTRVTIESEPPGAAIVIDGTSHGAAPVTLDAPADGELMVRASLDGYDAASQRIRVADVRGSVRVVLQPVPAAAVALDAGVDAPSAVIVSDRPSGRDERKGSGGRRPGGRKGGTGEASGHDSGSAAGTAAATGTFRTDDVLD